MINRFSKLDSTQIERKTWEEFRDAKLLWWVNKSLQLFGWSIIVNPNEDGTISECYPARVGFRGFTEENDDDGFVGLTQYLAENSEKLTKDIAPLIKDV